MQLITHYQTVASISTPSRRPGSTVMDDLIITNTEFSIVRNDRSVLENARQKGGGLAMFIHQDIDYEIVSLPSRKIIEIQLIRIRKKQNSPQSSRYLISQTSEATIGCEHKLRMIRECQVLPNVNNGDICGSELPNNVQSQNSRINFFVICFLWFCFS